MTYQNKSVPLVAFIMAMTLLIGTSVKGQTNRQWLSELLIKEGNTANKYFTFEGASDGRISYPNLKQRVPIDLSNEGVTQFLGSCSKILGGYDIIVDAKDNNIIHFVSRDLGKQPNYYMGETIMNARFSGSFCDYIEYLNFGKKAMSYGTAFTIGDGPIVDDPNLKVSVQVNNLTVRDALSQAFPKNYCRILWTSTCDLQTGEIFIKAPGTNIGFKVQAK
jgi:hypothetical protein